MKLSLLLCWLGIHRYKVIDVSFGFGQGGSVKTIECKICKIKKTIKPVFPLLRYTSPLYLSKFQLLGNRLGNTTPPLTLPKTLSIQTVR